ncbi:hypothetical protein [Amphibacillus indicireducens]|uniref:Tfp pilus assembly protein PilN n=1 Tax=Amphibacillus indicireducens TaxID=1076330 RepID=A0ABP7VG85_9BACI
MIEINFFERKKKDYSPLILVAIFIVGLFVIGGYVILVNGNLQTQHEENLTKISQQQTIVTELREIQTFSNQVRDIAADLELLQDNQYPTPQIYQTIEQLLPESDALYLLDYTFSINEGIRLSVQLVGLDQVIEIQRSLFNLSYVTHVELETVDLVNEEELHYVVNLIAEIDRDQLSEVIQND